MTYQLRRIGVLKAALVGGIAYAIMGLIFLPFFFLISMMPGPTGLQEDWMVGPVIALLLPLFYGVLGFVTSAIAAAVYNLIAMMVGGLEIELQEQGVTRAEPAT